MCGSCVVAMALRSPWLGSLPALQSPVPSPQPRLVLPARPAARPQHPPRVLPPALAALPPPEAPSLPRTEPLLPQLRISPASTLPAISAAKRVVLVRHGQSTWNEAGRIQGSSDFSVLTAKGESQAETSRQMLLADSFDCCFHSPLARAQRTAQIIWGSRRDPMIPIYDLREIDLYSFQGLMKNEGKEIYGDAYRTWQKDAPNFMIDGHYPVRELWARAQHCWETILASDARSILVVAHNAVNQALVATATGLGTQYFRQLLQSNCGVSVLDFSPRSGDDGPPFVCLDRLNQTPSPPVSVGQSGGRASGGCIVLVCHGATDSTVQKRFSASAEEPMNMLGVIQSRKTAELLLDVQVDLLISSPLPCALKTAAAIAEVQEAAECLGVECEPRFVQVHEMAELRDMNWGERLGKARSGVKQQDLLTDEITGAEKLSAFWERSGTAWSNLVKELGAESTDGGSSSKNLVVVAHEVVHAAMLANCLSLTQSSIGSFNLDTGSISVIDFPDGPSGRGVIRCLNYTAHLGRWAVPVTRPSLADEEF